LEPARRARLYGRGLETSTDGLSRWFAAAPMRQKCPSGLLLGVAGKPRGVIVRVHGITTVEDAAAVNALRPDNVGAVLDEGVETTWDSVSAPIVRAIVAELTDVNVVGLSLSSDADRVRRTVTIVQPAIVHLARIPKFRPLIARIDRARVQLGHDAHRCTPIDSYGAPVFASRRSCRGKQPSPFDSSGEQEVHGPPYEWNEDRERQDVEHTKTGWQRTKGLSEHARQSDDRAHHNDPKKKPRQITHPAVLLVERLLVDLL